LLLSFQYFNCATLSKHMLAIFMSWFYTTFCWWDSNIHLVFSEFMSWLTPLLTCFSHGVISQETVQ
jgi:hypothetical protein